MKKWIVLGVLAMIALATLPGIRDVARPHMGPVPRWIDMGAARAMQPYRRWVANGEATHLSRTLAELRATGRDVPPARRFQSWAGQHLSSNPRALDPWGQSYEVRYYGDSVVVFSPGADGLEKTEDDVIAGTRADN